MLDDALFETHLALPDRRQGKVRDVYRLPELPERGGPGTAGGPRLLIVSTDRISAFDVVMPTPVPGKGALLTSMSLSWFAWLRRQHLVGDHLIGSDVADLPLERADQDRLRDRIMICRAAQVVPIECVVRGYLAGSGWSEYRQRGDVCGVPLPGGLRQGDRLPEPIFTPATKAAEGHDQNIDFERAAALVGRSLMDRLRSISVEVYTRAAAHALARGIILADTKFEFGFALDALGRPTDELLLVDELLTPDSSRFWPLDGWKPGAEQPSFDKQYLREWLLHLVAEGRWDKCPPGPAIPATIVEATLDRYREAQRRLWG